MPLNPNSPLTGKLPPLPQPGKNVNPTGVGGSLGAFQPQSPFGGATMNSTEFSPVQYAGLPNVVGPFESNVSGYPGSLWLDILNQQQQQNTLYQQQLAGLTGPQGMQAQILQYAKQLEDQARAAVPRSGAYWFIGGL